MTGEGYVLLERPAAGLARVRHPSGDVALWAWCQVRKRHVCRITGREQGSGTMYRPVGNQMYRYERISLPGMDALAAPVSAEYPPTCEVLPQRQPWGPGWYLIAANRRVEAGPFSTQEEAEAVASYMDEHSLGVNPSPWRPAFSPRGLTIGTRVRATRHKVGACVLSE